MADGAGCVRKCCHSHSVMLVDAQGDTSCHRDPRAEHHEPEEVASAAKYNEQRALEAREWGPGQHRHPDHNDTGTGQPGATRL